MQTPLPTQTHIATEITAKVFVGSSRESLDIAYAVQENLEHRAEITVWDQGLFDLSRYTLESLVSFLEQFDFGIFVFAADDVLRLRGVEYQSARDNVIFELGLFTGSIGRDRNFILVPRDCERLHLPTDLLGMTPATYDSKRLDGNMVAAVAPSCNKILRQILRQGPIVSKTKVSTQEKMHPSRLTPDSPLLNKIVKSAIHTVCRAVALPQSAEAAKIRVFIFRKDGNQLVCSHYWAPNPVSEMVGKLKFEISPEKAKEIAVVRCVIDERITRTKVLPLTEGPESIRAQISDELGFVLAAPIYNADGTIWGTVDFDASTKAGEMFLSDEVSDAAIYQLAQHLKNILSLPS